MKLKHVVLTISIVLFLASLTQPAYLTSSGTKDGGGTIWLVIIGWMGALLGGANVAWFANPLIIACWIFMAKNKILYALETGLYALFFSALFLFYHKIMGDEAGNYYQITARLAGYWLWLGSCFVAGVGSVIIYFLNKKSSQQAVY